MQSLPPPSQPTQSPTPKDGEKPLRGFRKAFDESLRGHDGTVSAREVITYLLTLAIIFLAVASLFFDVRTEIIATLAGCLTAAITSYSFEKR